LVTAFAARLDGVRVAGWYPLQFLSGFNLSDMAAAKSLSSTAGQLGNVHQDSNGVSYLEVRQNQTYGSLVNLNQTVMVDGLILHAYFRRPSLSSVDTLLRFQLGSTNNTFVVRIEPKTSESAKLVSSTLKEDSTTVECSAELPGATFQSWTSLTVMCASFKAIETVHVLPLCLDVCLCEGGEPSSGTSSAR
jgi:hypothetical protein